VPRPLSTELGGTGRNDGTFPLYVQILGGVGDGSHDDTAAIQAVANASTFIDLRGPFTWVITSTITLRAGTTIDWSGASIVLSTGATPGFSFANGNAILNMQGGGAISGTASTALFLQGTTNQPTTQAHYASQILLSGVSVSSSTITSAIQMDKAVKSVVINKCNFFTPNGILASGACIEVMCSDSIIYSATGASGTRGIQLRSTGGTTYYNQGWSFVDCTIDNFEITHDVSDVYVYEVAGGYTGCNAALAASTGYAFQFAPPANTNLTEVITVDGGAVINGRMRFASSGSGQAYNARVEALFTGTPGTAIALENNASNIEIDCFFKAGSSSPIAVLGSNNNHHITARGWTDTTYVNACVLNGSNGSDCVIGPWNSATSGDVFGVSRAVRYIGVPIHSTGTASLRTTASANNLGGGATYTVGTNIETLAMSFIAGETGRIVVNLQYSGANAATQNIQVNGPTGMVFNSGTGWNAHNLYLGAAAGLLHAHVDYYCNADGSGNVTVNNQAGNTLTVNNQGYCAIVRDI